MASFFSRVLITTIATLVASYLLEGVYVNTITTAFIVAIVLGLLNAVIKPILIILTLPITVLTLGLFLLVINILIIKLAAAIVPGFDVYSWWAALLFSFIISIVGAILEMMVRDKKN